MSKLKYFIARKQAKNHTTDYYWQCKKSVAEKYGVEVFVSLGKDEKEALIKWHALNSKFEYNKGYLKEKGILPLNETRHHIEEGTLEHISQLYIQDRRFIRLAPRTKKEYLYIIKRLNYSLIYATQKQPFAKLKVATIDRLFCKTVYEQFLTITKRVAQEFINALRNILTTAIDYGYLKGENPCNNLVIEKNHPRQEVWLKEEFNKFCNKAKEQNYIGLFIAIQIAFYTAQRQTDILCLQWKDIDEDYRYIDISQSKTNAKVSIPLFKMPILQSIIKSLHRTSGYVVIDHKDKMSYHKRVRHFQDRFDDIRKLTDMRQNLWFKDLRRTAILTLDEAGCTPSEISSFSGHSRKTIIDMLEIYAPKTKAKAIAAIDKLNNNLAISK